MDDNLVLIETRLVGDRSTRVLGSTAGDQGLGAVEGGAVASLNLLVGVGLLAELLVSDAMIKTEYCKTYALKSGLGSLSGLVASCSQKKASAIALVQNSQNLLLHDAVGVKLGE